MSDIGYQCSDCGAKCDGTWSRSSFDITPTDRGDWRQDFTEYFCDDCAEIFMPAQFWGDPELEGAKLICRGEDPDAPDL
jgi:DNA-directed RNA polymerase subunit RPC12/RpoP